MGEARRRHAPNEADRLPDFIFGRDKAAEKAGGFILAGRLVTDIPKRERPSESDQRMISEIVECLTREAKRDPDMSEASIWRGGVKPANATPISDAAVIARMRRCAVVVVRVDPRSDGLMRLDESLLADIVGRH